MKVEAHGDGVEVVEHEDGSVDIIFDADKMPPMRCPRESSEICWVLSGSPLEVTFDPEVACKRLCHGKYGCGGRD